MAQDENKRKELSRLSMEAQIAQQQIAGVQNQISAIGSTVIETKASIEALKNLEAVKGNDVLLPIGSGVLINATYTGKGKVLIEIGGGVIAEKPFSEAKSLLEKRLAEVEETRDKLQSVLESVSGRLRELDKQAKSIITGMKNE